MVALDLQDAYFHFPVLQSHRCYLPFQKGHKPFQFLVLPFGLSRALLGVPAFGGWKYEPSIPLTGC